VGSPLANGPAYETRARLAAAFEKSRNGFRNRVIKVTGFIRIARSKISRKVHVYAEIETTLTGRQVITLRSLDERKHADRQPGAWFSTPISRAKTPAIAFVAPYAPALDQLAQGCVGTSSLRRAPALAPRPT